MNTHTIIRSTMRLSLSAALLVAGLVGGASAWAADAASQQAGAAIASTPAPGLPRILVLATGGTISGTADPRSAIGYNSGNVKGQELVRGVPGIEKLASISAEQISNVGSQDMNDKIWFQLARRIQEAFDRNEADGVVITHGTDTIEETAFFLHNVLRTNKPVVLVGSMRPGGTTSADGPNNLYEAVEVAASAQSRDRGVMVVMNDQIHAPRWITKTNTTAVQAFASPNAGAIGYVDPASVRFVTPALQPAREALSLPANDQLPRVDIVYAHSNMDGRQIDHAIADGAKGIVVAGEGDGDASKEALAALDRAVKKGIVVVRSTRVVSGFVNRNVEVDDDKRGFVVSLDLNPQKARLLTQLLVVNGVTDPAKVQQAFSGTW
ncbi:asparaginase [Caballeronia ptereochthonis]|uniref:L-asparaginase n=1 Tax=Caballeronia ptereochthonis TaxID=1777144 RepID=A0A157ZUU3_9BURK|nr:asparaginase [Caballeronia ptereochthonis]SAK49324.1 L-asparaginase [Caballeronia ptereochthonis]